MRVGILHILALLLPFLPAYAQQGNGHDAEREFRGVWIATVAGLDWPDVDQPPIVQQVQLLETMKAMREAGCNTVIFQAVSNMDAVYPSELLPWSAVLTGTEGVDPGYDPLDIAVKAAHECGMQIHAWINPLRVARRDDQPHDSLHVSISHPDWVQNYRHKLYLDPGNPEVIDFLAMIAEEIVGKYDVDGLHIDDYFYPPGLADDGSGREWKETFYNGPDDKASLDEWRFGNIDKVVAALYESTHETRPGAVFGVSPSGRLVNTRHLYADPARWAKAGTVDYLAPQIYWATGRTDEAEFGKVLDSWKYISRGIPVYVGIAAYKHDDAYYRGQDMPYMHLSEFGKEIDLCRAAKYVDGHIWFRAEHVAREEIKAYILSEIYGG